MKRFDYKVLSVASLSEESLKKLGSEGWRFKQIYTEAGTGAQRAIFEKELPKDGME